MCSTGLSDDPAIAFILTSVVELPSNVVAYYLVDVWGRKPLQGFSLILAGVTCIPAGFLTSGTTAQLVLILAGKFGTTLAFRIAYLYTAELFPTEVRGSAIGLTSMMSRLGAIAAPEVCSPQSGIFGVLDTVVTQND